MDASPQSFARPPWMVWLNLVAAALFALIFVFYVLTQKYLFGVFWLAIAVFWFSRFRWARQAPFLEVTEDELIAYLSPARSQRMPLAELRAVGAAKGAVELELEDGSKIRFTGSDIVSDELPRLAEVLAARQNSSSQGSG